MSSDVEVFIDEKDKPSNIPSHDTIITKCFELAPLQANAINISGVHIALDKRSDNDISGIWVKFGFNTTMAEARTQRFISQYLEHNDNPIVRAPRVYVAFTYCGYGYIVGEYIDGRMCDKSDIHLVVDAIQSLINIPNPTPAVPGPVGGGLIEHPFFFDRRSSIWYESIKELQDHINGILAVTERKGRVDFKEECASHGLPLCVSDLELVNFMRDNGSRIVAVDFGGYSFLPPSFFVFAIKRGRGSILAQRIARILDYPSSTTVRAMVSASCALVPFTSNDIGLPSKLKPRLHMPPPA